VEPEPQLSAFAETEYIPVLNLVLDPTKNGIQKPNKVKKSKIKVGTGTAINRYRPVPQHCLKTWSESGSVPYHYILQLHAGIRHNSVPVCQKRHLASLIFLRVMKYWTKLPVRRNPTEPVSPKNTLLEAEVLEEARLVLSQNIRQVEFALIQQVDIRPNLHK
jgi:hypothetical protein